MAALTAQQRTALWQEYMDWLSRNHVALPGCAKADVKAAGDALDTWINDNAAVMNTALPQPFRANAPANAKAKLFSLIMEARFKAGA